MKVSIPLNSSLCTDSHPNVIKNPESDRNLFKKNQSYLYNNHLTNAKKKVVDTDNYITTNGDELKIIEGSLTTQISHNNRLIASVNSLGIEDTIFLDVDDAVIFEDNLYTVKKTVEGYTVETTHLVTKIKTETIINQDINGRLLINLVRDVRFIRNTNKVIARLTDSIIINGKPYNDPDMVSYLTFFAGEFIAVEENGNIYFGYNNPAGVTSDAPTETITININSNANSWILINNINFDQQVGYNININIADNIQIGQLDLITGIINPGKHIINLSLGNNSIISGHGGNGAGFYYFPQTGLVFGNGQDGGSAIRVASFIFITGNGTIQGGGGGGGGGFYSRVQNLAHASGGGGAGIPAGNGGIITISGTNNSAINQGSSGSVNNGGQGGNAGVVNYSNLKAGSGGNPGENGYYENIINGAFSNFDGTSTRLNNGLAGNAIEVNNPAKCTVAPSVTIKGNIVYL